MELELLCRKIEVVHRIGDFDATLQHLPRKCTLHQKCIEK